jgi:hypothetical protein
VFGAKSDSMMRPRIRSNQSNRREESNKRSTRPMPSGVVHFGKDWCILVSLTPLNIPWGMFMIRARDFDSPITPATRAANGR